MSAAKKDAEIKPEFWIVAIDETRHFNIAVKDAPSIETIGEVYLYNRNEHTYCCEPTPSYWLEPLYTYINFKSGTPDEIQERLEEKYCYEPGDDCYMHVRTVEAISKDEKHRIDVLDVDPEDAREAARDYAQGNRML